MQVITETPTMVNEAKLRRAPRSLTVQAKSRLGGGEYPASRLGGGEYPASRLGGGEYPASRLGGGQYPN